MLDPHNGPLVKTQRSEQIQKSFSHLGDLSQNISSNAWRRNLHRRNNPVEESNTDVFFGPNRRPILNQLFFKREGTAPPRDDEGAAELE